jgi:hypothetical protein
VSYTNNEKTNAGVYTVTAHFADSTGNYNVPDDMTAKLTINKKTYDMTGVSFNDASYTYDGTEKTIVIAGSLPDGVTVSYTNNRLTDAGSVEATAAFAGDSANYEAITGMKATLTIGKKTITGVSLSGRHLSHMTGPPRAYPLQVLFLAESLLLIRTTVRPMLALTPSPLISLTRLVITRSLTT